MSCDPPVIIQLNEESLDSPVSLDILNKLLHATKPVLAFQQSQCQAHYGVPFQQWVPLCSLSLILLSALEQCPGHFKGAKIKNLLILFHQIVNNKSLLNLQSPGKY